MIPKEIKEKVIIKILEQSATVIVLSFGFYFVWGFAIKNYEKTINCLEEQNRVVLEALSNNTKVQEETLAYLKKNEDEN